MAGRKINLNTRYKVYLRNDKKYRYAAVLEPLKDEKTGKIKYKIIHLGTVDDDLIFIPNKKFELITEEEREKFIFPKEWNILRANLKNKNNKYNIEKDPAKSSEKNFNCQTNVKKDCSV